MSSGIALNQKDQVISVAVPVPLRQCFDFLLPQTSLFDQAENSIQAAVGARVSVSFGSRKLIGVISDIKSTSDYPIEKLKSAHEIIDRNSLFEPSLWSTLEWLSRYYLAPIGEVVEAAMPVALRQGAELMPSPVKVWRLTDHARSANLDQLNRCLLYTSPSPRDQRGSRMPSSA